MYKIDSNDKMQHASREINKKKIRQTKLNFFGHFFKTFLGVFYLQRFKMPSRN